MFGDFNNIKIVPSVFTDSAMQNDHASTHGVTAMSQPAPIKLHSRFADINLSINPIRDEINNHIATT
jgi:hypothetical protein